MELKYKLVGVQFRGMAPFPRVRAPLVAMDTISRAPQSGCEKKKKKKKKDQGRTSKIMHGASLPVCGFTLPWIIPGQYITVPVSSAMCLYQ